MVAGAAAMAMIAAGFADVMRPKRSSAPRQEGQRPRNQLSRRGIIIRRAPRASTPLPSVPSPPNTLSLSILGPIITIDIEPSTRYVNEELRNVFYKLGCVVYRKKNFHAHKDLIKYSISLTIRKIIHMYYMLIFLF